MSLNDCFPDDVARLTRVAAAHGCTVAQDDAVDLWQKHSESVFAGWLMLPASDEELWQLMQPLLPHPSRHA